MGLIGLFFWKYERLKNAVQLGGGILQIAFNGMRIDTICIHRLAVPNNLFKLAFGKVFGYRYKSVSQLIGGSMGNFIIIAVSDEPFTVSLGTVYSKNRFTGFLEVLLLLEQLPGHIIKVKIPDGIGIFPVCTFSVSVY